VTGGQSGGSVPPDQVSSRVLAALDGLDALSAENGRTDLSARARALRERVANPFVPLLVLGRFKAGKSSLINALVGLEICPVDADVATSAMTLVRQGETFAATIFGQSGPDGERPVGRSVTKEELAAAVTESAGAFGASSVSLAEVRVPSELLRDGLCVVDTPGGGNLGPGTASALLRNLSGTRGIIFVSEANRQLTPSDRALLQELSRALPAVICVLSKCDLQVHWRDVRDVNAGFLQTLGLADLQVPTAAALRQVPAQSGADDHESGIPELSRLLRSQVLAPATVQISREAALEGRDLSGLLRVTLQAGKQAMDPATQEESLLRLRQATAAARRLVGANAEWRIFIDDGTHPGDPLGVAKGVEELVSEVPYLTGQALRAAQAKIGQYIESADLDLIHDQLEEIVESELLAAIESCQQEVRQSIGSLAARVQREFDQEATEVVAGLPSFNVATLTENTTAMQRVEEAEERRMFGVSMDHVEAFQDNIQMVIEGLAGLAVGALNPLGLITLPFSVFLSIRQIRRQKAQRHAEMRERYRSAVREYLEERTEQIEHAWLTELRRERRRLRQLFGGLAEELSRSAEEALSASERSVAAVDRHEALSRLAALDSALEKLDQLDADLAGTLEHA
jgi:hypothetical protein